MATIALNSQKPLVVLESQNENTKIFNFNDKEIMLEGTLKFNRKVDYALQQQSIR